MSRWTLPYKAGVVMVLAAFVIGITAASAMAWPGGEPQPPPANHGDKDKDKNKGHDDDDDDEGKGGHEKPKPQPKPPVTPPAGQPSPPGPAAVPPAAPPPPVVSQGAPPPPEQPAQNGSVPPEQGGVPDNPVVAQAPPEAGAPVSPAAERQELAKTGLDPALIALLGAACLGGGALMFRRALARN